MSYHQAMTPPWRVQDIGDSMMHRSTRTSRVDLSDWDLTEVDFEGDEGYDVAVVVILDGFQGGPQPVIWPMRLGPDDEPVQ